MKNGAQSSSLCKSCTAACCRYYEEIEISSRDITRIAAFLGAQSYDIGRQYINWGPDGSRILRKDREGWCVFIENYKCSIYRARPDICRDYMPPTCLEDGAFQASLSVRIADVMKLLELEG